MFSTPDIAIIGILALLLFGPDKLPGMLRTAGRYMRDIQNTSHSFVAEMERAADAQDRPVAAAQQALPAMRDDEPPVPEEDVIESPWPPLAAPDGS